MVHPCAILDPISTSLFFHTFASLNYCSCGECLLWFIAVLVATNIASAVMCMAIGAAAPSNSVANMVSCVCDAPTGSFVQCIHMNARHCVDTNCVAESLHRSPAWSRCCSFCSEASLNNQMNDRLLFLTTNTGCQPGDDAAPAVWRLPAQQAAGACILPMDCKAVLLQLRV